MALPSYGFDQSLQFTDLEEMLTKAHPQAVLVYTNTYDHRRVVEICARHGVHVMMEKPLAVSLEDALAIAEGRARGKIHVLVNYETSWYRSNHAAYDLVHDGALGEIRKVVVHDGHQGPKEIGVQPEFLAWLTDPKLNGGRSAFRLRMLRSRSDDLADGRRNARRPSPPSRSRSSRKSTRTWTMRRLSFLPIRSAGDHSSLVELAVRSQRHGSVRAERDTWIQ